MKITKPKLNEKELQNLKGMLFLGITIMSILIVYNTIQIVQG